MSVRKEAGAGSCEFKLRRIDRVDARAVSCVIGRSSNDKQSPTPWLFPPLFTLSDHHNHHKFMRPYQRRKLLIIHHTGVLCKREEERAPACRGGLFAPDTVRHALTRWGKVEIIPSSLIRLARCLV